jgi:hypothetical protein
MIATLSRAAQSLAPIEKQLADALAQVRRREARRAAIEAKWRKRTSIDFFVGRLQQAESDYARTESDEDLERACLAECALEKAKVRAGVARMQIRSDVDIIGYEFANEFPDNRELLTRACSLRLKVEQSKCKRVVEATEKHLSAEGFTPEQIAQWPSIKDARRVVELFSDTLESLPTKPVEKLWRAADTLLE